MSDIGFLDFSDYVPEKKFGAIPAGTYVVSCVDVELKTSKAGKPIAKVKYSINEGDYAGKNVYDNLNMSGDPAVLNITKGKVHTFMSASTGMTIEEIKSKGGLKVTDMVGKTCLASIKLNPAKDGYDESNSISYFKPLSKEQKEATSGAPF